jgi:hypothetical protein
VDGVIMMEQECGLWRWVMELKVGESNNVMALSLVTDLVESSYNILELRNNIFVLLLAIVITCSNNSLIVIIKGALKVL